MGTTLYWIILALTAVRCLTTTNDIDEGFSFGCIIVERGSTKLVDCSSRDLSFIPTLPKTATVVDLSNNSISIIFYSPFEGMSILSEIDLSDNPLESVPFDLFKGLTNLRKLSIQNSLLYNQKTLVLSTLLSGLINLKCLSFTFKLPENTRFSPLPCTFKYKSQPFGNVDCLQSVDTLEIDSALLKWHTKISTRLVYTTKSLHVINGFVCYYYWLGKEQFEYMPLLENLSISIPILNSRILDKFVESQTHLKQLAIYGPNAPDGNAKDLIYNVSSSVSGLRNMSTLILNNISNGIRLKFYCHDNIYNLTNLVQLTTVSLEGNSLSFDDMDGCDKFPTSLKHLNLQYNCLSSFDIHYRILFYNKQIETIDASDQSKCDFMLRSGKYKAVSYSKYKRPNEFMVQTMIFTNSSDALNFGYDNEHFPHLRYLDLSLNSKVPRTVIPYFFSSGRPNLQYLKMSECRIFELEEHSFSNFSKLEYLDLSQNMLGSMKSRLSMRLANLTSLKELNIASNQIQYMPPEFFYFMLNIEKIDISTNEVNDFEMALTTVKKLNYLDLSHNRLQKLSENIRKDLDILAITHPIKLDLSGNMLLCTCETLEFLQWIKDTKVNLLWKNEYVCSYSNGTVTVLRNIWHIINHLKSDCASKTVFVVIVSSVTAFCLVCVCAIFAYKFRWKIRYLYYKTKIKIPYKTTGHGYEQIFEYDVFVSYSSEDREIARQETITELEAKRDIRACIHERDFIAGESIALNISKGIHSSKRTILFLSSSFLASEWCMYELNIARMESLHSGRKVILVVLLENIPHKSLPVDVLDIIHTYTYLEYPRHGTRGDLDVFWSKCADFISQNTPSQIYIHGYNGDN